MRTGYYSPDLSVKGVHVAYWNDIAVRYGSGDPNDATNFSKEACIRSTLAYLSDCGMNGSTSFIQLPINQVWSITDWEPASWLADIVIATRDHPALEGFYLADEPEVWGYSEPSADGVPINVNPPLTHSFLHTRYLKCKQLAPDVPVLVVFCDLSLYDKSYGGKAPFYDVFGFDYYPYTEHEGHALQWQRYSDWKRRAGDYPIMYVAQGSGFSSGWMDGDVFKRFGQLDMTDMQFDEQFRRARNEFGSQMEYYLLWDWHYADSNMRRLGQEHFLRIRRGDLLSPYQRPKPLPNSKQSIFARILNLFKSIFK